MIVGDARQTVGVRDTTSPPLGIGSRHNKLSANRHRSLIAATPPAAPVRHSGARQRRLSAERAAKHWRASHPTWPGVAANCRLGPSRRWRMPIETGLPDHRESDGGAIRRPRDEGAARAGTHPLLRSCATGVRRSADRRAARRYSTTRRGPGSVSTAERGRRRLFLNLPVPRFLDGQKFQSWFTPSSETAAVWFVWLRESVPGHVHVGDQTVRAATAARRSHPRTTREESPG